LSTVRPILAGAVKVVVEAAHDPDAAVRRHAAAALANLGSRAESGVAALIRMLDKEQFEVADEAGKSLGTIGSVAVSALIGAIESEGSEQARTLAVRALGKIGSHAESAVPKLVDCLRDASHLVRRTAAWSLGKIGQESVGTVRRLSDALYDKHPHVSANARVALRRIRKRHGAQAEAEA
jgi:HEAT repeat protein